MHHSNHVCLFLMDNPPKSPKINSTYRQVIHSLFTGTFFYTELYFSFLSEGQDKGCGEGERQEGVGPGSALSQNTSKPRSPFLLLEAAVSFCYPFALQLKQQQLMLLRVPGFGEGLLGILTNESFYAFRNP